MNSTEMIEALNKIEEIEVQWDDRRKVITVFDFHNHKSELEALGFDCSSPMFANMTFAEERKITAPQYAPSGDRSNWVKQSGPDKTPEWALR